MSTFALHKHYIEVHYWTLCICACGLGFDGDDSIDRIRMHFLDELLDEWHETEMGRWWLEEYEIAEQWARDPDAGGECLRDAEDRLAGLEYYRANVMNELWTKHLEN